METKRCYVCGMEKVHKLFSRDRSKSDGRMSRCKVCDLERGKSPEVVERRRIVRVANREQKKIRADLKAARVAAFVATVKLEKSRAKRISSILNI